MKKSNKDIFMYATFLVIVKENATQEELQRLYATADFSYFKELAIKYCSISADFFS